ncbi:MAG TPA: hypothetical protein DG753_06625 [Clostridium sp.]|nr:hypothetical protein [Clostridium sp.]
MKFRKTPTEKRNTYIYYGESGKIEITPGKDGVTEIDIKQLYSYDDAEVYNNIKNSRAKSTDEEKKNIKEWEELHPGEKAPRNWNISIDAAIDGEGSAQDKSKVLESAYYSIHEEESLELEILHDIITTLSDEQQLLYKKIILEGYSNTEIAKAEGVSVTAVSKRMKRIYEHIKRGFQKKLS